ncbi:MAG: GNAT family N-acetyltransferase [Bdellovibrionales bacterium]|nr:GNAT family N-acetyltransferase [Bdellovibrionales bacterium]
MTSKHDTSKLSAAEPELVIRRARVEDARAIHEVHMRSIREVCSKDHTLAEIQAWGGREFDEAQRIDAIKNDYVWVVEREEAFNHEDYPESEIQNATPGINMDSLAHRKPSLKLIVGFARLDIRPRPKDNLQPVVRRARIMALYLGSEVLRKGVGRELVERMEEVVRDERIDKITLESTISAHKFYKRMGFIDSGPMTTIEINSERIRCFPMQKLL